MIDPFFIIIGALAIAAFIALAGAIRAAFDIWRHRHS
jgi:hypothetical protein